MIKIFVLVLAMFVFNPTAHAGTLKLPLEKFTASPALEMRCMSGSQSLSFPIPERWNVHKIVLSLHYTVSNTVVSNISQMAIKFNGEHITQMKLNPEAPTVTTDVAIPVTHLEPGYNTIAFQVAQHYLTNQCEEPCSPNLWTSVSVKDSFLEIDYDLKPLPLQLGKTTGWIFDPKQFPEAAVNLVMDSTSPESVTMAGVVASGIASHFDYRNVKFSHSTDIKPGMDNVLVGTTKFAAATLAQYGINVAQADGGLIKLFHLPGGGQTVDNLHALIVIAGDDQKPLKIAAETFANMSLPYPGTDELRAYEFSMPDISMYGGKMVLTSDKAYNFKSLGMSTSSLYGFNGKASREGNEGTRSELSFRLPPDFLIKQNQYAKLVLNFAYSSGMRTDSTLGLSVNDKRVRDIHLDRVDGNYIDGYQLDLPTYLFKPGVNTIAFQSYLSTHRQLCDSINSDAPFVTIHENSTLYFPPMPHLVEMPKLELFSLNGFPFTRWPDGFETLVYLPQPDNASIDTAFNLIGMISQKNGFPLFGTQVTFTEPVDWKGEMLVVGKTSAIPQAMMDQAPMQVNGVATIPYPVKRSWDSESSISLSKQKSGLGIGSGLLMEFESARSKGRSVVLATAQTDNDLLALGDALLNSGVQARISGDIALIKLDVPNYDLTSLSVGKKYSTGDKGKVSFIDSILYSNAYVLYGVIALTITVLGWLGYRLLGRYRRQRQGTGEKS
ncbi:MAG: cellulose biosynthesis cyclic di-GMP-binding regulatory protein BcsB [Nitrosomonadales bacterium]|nr:cellulose biosynthesis cyclic di-GMP-binding regulatory protein BcsB [Nitrosomonadales bacterium]